MTALARRCAALAELSDVDLGARFLSETATHEGRSPEQLREWARTALEFGDELAAREDSAPDVVIRESDGGVRADEVVLAEYEHRQHTVTVYTGSLKLVGEVVAAAGWADDVTPEALREAVVAHEVVHHLLHGSGTRELNKRLGHTAARIGRFRVRGHVVGADELVAHRYAHRRSGLGRSPLLVNAALAAKFGG
jgi:hypothetical protein